MAKPQGEIRDVPGFAPQYPRIAVAMARYGREANEMAQHFPRLLTTIENGWGTPDCYEYINKLLFSDRSGRQGFSSEVVSELILIKNIFEIEFPRIANNPFDPFSKLRASEIEEKAKELQHSKNIAVGGGESGSIDKSRKSTESSQPKAKSHEINSVAVLKTQLERLEQGAVPIGNDRKLLGEYLVSFGAADIAAINHALEYQKKAPIHHLLGECLLSEGTIEKQQLNKALSMQRGIPVVDVAAIDVTPDAVRLVPIRIARLKAAMPIAFQNRHLVVAVTDPFDAELQEYFSFLSGTRAVLVFASAESIAAAHGNYTHGNNKEGLNLGAGSRQEPGKNGTGGKHSASLSKQSNSESLHHVDDIGEDADDINAVQDDAGAVDENDETVIGLVNKVVNDAVRVGASDVHFEAFPRTKNAQIRFRKDGVMEAHTTYPLSYHAAVVSRIKIMSELDISERRKSQDGKISFGQGSKRLDLRVSTIPTSNSLETVTIRILSSGKPLPLSKLGMHPSSLEAFRNEIAKPYGLILVCGPTGSGKTTTLHSVLRELNTPDRKIWTAEDPVEVVQRNISQVQVLPKIGWTFANALRAFLRADPDIIMIGEIRDSETAKVAVEASMTGHLVFSTLHTNSASETLARLIDLDVAAFNLADAVLAILAQRLARRVCTECGDQFEFSSDELETLVNEYHYAGSGKTATKAERDRLLASWRAELSGGKSLAGIRAVGCNACNGSGYRGRLGIHELLVVSPELRRLVRAKASSGELFRQAISDGMRTLRQDGIEKVAQGLTDLKEIRTVCL